MSTQVFPVIPLRDVVLFPEIIMPLFLGRAKSIAALGQGPGPIFFVAQKDASEDATSAQDLYDVGTLGDVAQSMPLPDGGVKIVVKGLRRARRQSLANNGRFLEAELSWLGDAVKINHDAGNIQAHIENASQVDQSRLKPWPVADFQKLLEDESLGDLDRLKRLRELAGF